LYYRLLKEYQIQQKLKHEKKLKRIQQQQRMRSLSYYKNPRKTLSVTENILNDTINSNETTSTTTTTNTIDDNKLKIISTSNTITIPSSSTSLSSTKMVMKSSINEKKRDSTRFITSKANLIWDTIQIKPNYITTIINDNKNDSKNGIKNDSKNDSKNNDKNKKNINKIDSKSNSLDDKHKYDGKNQRNVKDMIEDDIQYTNKNYIENNCNKSIKNIIISNSNNFTNNDNNYYHHNYHHNDDDDIDRIAISEEEKSQLVFDSNSYDIIILEQLIRLHYPGILDTTNATTTTNTIITMNDDNVDEKQSHEIINDSSAIIIINDKNVDKNPEDIPLKKYATITMITIIMITIIIIDITTTTIIITITTTTIIITITTTIITSYYYFYFYFYYHYYFYYYYYYYYFYPFILIDLTPNHYNFWRNYTGITLVVIYTSSFISINDNYQKKILLFSFISVRKFMVLVKMKIILYQWKTRFVECIIQLKRAF